MEGLVDKVAGLISDEVPPEEVDDFMLRLLRRRVVANGVASILDVRGLRLNIEQLQEGALLLNPAATTALEVVKHVVYSKFVGASAPLVGKALGLSQHQIGRKSVDILLETQRVTSVHGLSNDFRTDVKAWCDGTKLFQPLPDNKPDVRRKLATGVWLVRAPIYKTLPWRDMYTNFLSDCQLATKDISFTTFYDHCTTYMWNIRSMKPERFEHH
jgi:hypothetical protein